MDRATGQVRVERMWAAQEMGVVLNPEGAAMQMEGCITMGLGYALMEYIRFQGGDIRDRNSNSYAIPRFEHLPEIYAVLVPNDDLPPQGGGEPAIVRIGATIANAIFDACAARMFTMPFTPARVRRAMG